MTLPGKPRKAGPGGTSNYSKRDLRYGWKEGISSALFQIPSLLPNEKDLSQSQKSFPLSPTNSNSHSCGKSTTCSMLSFYPPIMKMKSMEGTSLLHHLISSIMKNTMKSRKSYITKELCPVNSISSNGRITQLKKTPGFLKQNSPLLRNSSRTIKTPYIHHTL